jgi:hypothetical protein
MRGPSIASFAGSVRIRHHGYSVLEPLLRSKRKQEIKTMIYTKDFTFVYVEAVFRIRIRIDFGQLNRHLEGQKMTRKNRKRENFSSFKVLDVLF